jgi:hypothetical protein
MGTSKQRWTARQNISLYHEDTTMETPSLERSALLILLVEFRAQLLRSKAAARVGYGRGGIEVEKCRRKALSG